MSIEVGRADACRLWLHRQGLAEPRGSERLNKRSLTALLERVGALQVDSVNVLDRAHYLTLWSRFGAFDRKRLDRMIYQDGVAYEYWGHEASILPISHLPIGLRRMKRFPPDSWSGRAWWKVYDTSIASKRRVLRRLRDEGPLESIDFEASNEQIAGGWATTLPKEDKRSLKLHWHSGRVAIRGRNHFRCVYDLAERIYPVTRPATTAAYQDSWLLTGISGNGIAGVSHLRNYFTGPELNATEQNQVIARNLRKKRIVELRVEGVRGACYTFPEYLDGLREIPEPSGTTLVCPFDSLLWQRKRAEELLDFSYRIEIYVPAPKRKHGYYVLPILHDGRLVGRLDPKLHRDRGELEIKTLLLEPGFKPSKRFDGELRDALWDLCEFVGVERLRVPRGWSRRIG